MIEKLFNLLRVLFTGFKFKSLLKKRVNCLSLVVVEECLYLFLLIRFLVSLYRKLFPQYYDYLENNGFLIIFNAKLASLFINPRENP